VLQYPLEQDVLFPLASIGTLSHFAPNAALLFGLCLALLLIFYLSAYAALRRAASSSEGLSERAAQVIIIFPVLAMLILAHLYPITSLDSINQDIQIRVLTAHHANPLITPASAFSSDPFTTYDDRQNFSSPYGPLWVLLSAGPALLAGNNLLALALLEKMIPIVFALGCLRVIWLIATKVAPYRRWQALLLIGWNPLVLLETAGNGHNESIMLFFVLLSFYSLISNSRWRWFTLPALALAALVNSAALIFLPLLAVALWRMASPTRRLVTTLGNSGGAALLLVAALIPFGGVRAVHSLLQPLDQFALSLPAMLYRFLQPLYNEAQAAAIVKALAVICFGLWYLLILYRLIRRNSLQPINDKNLSANTLVIAGYEVVFWFFTLAALAFQPWMILWLIPFAALDARLMPLVRATILTAGGLFVPLILIFIAHGALVSGALNLFTVQLIAVLLLFVPVLFVRFIEAIYQRRRLVAALAAREAELARLQRELHITSEANISRAPE
ncbi:MAG TPA: hypothetical protein VFU32_06305, partial [Ktedonobacterales bacterium]|nr:hypothetical protein [Ktedonobacterales bacterium]